MTQGYGTYLTRGIGVQLSPRADVSDKKGHIFLRRPALRGNRRQDGDAIGRDADLKDDARRDEVALTPIGVCRGAALPLMLIFR